MARPCRLLVAGLLAALALLPAAAAIFGPQSGSPCDPTSLANHVSDFCSPDMPTPQCCAPVVAAVDFGGGVPCLCRAAADPRLVVAGINTSRLLAMYSSCGGLNPAAAHFTAACQGPSSAIIDGSASSPTSGHRQASHVLVPAADFRTTSIRPVTLSRVCLNICPKMNGISKMRLAILPCLHSLSPSLVAAMSQTLPAVEQL